jgi:hypothetical protein
MLYCYACMYIIRLTRRVGAKDDPPIMMWLTTSIPMRWGERTSARRFHTKGEAGRVAGALRVVGAWSVDEA